MSIATASTTDTARALERLLRRAAARWRLRGALEGLLVALTAIAVAAAGATVFIEAGRFEPGVVQAGRGVLGGLAALVFAALGLGVLLRRMDRRRAARYLEARAPALDGVLLTAAGAAAQGRDGGLWPGVVEQAVASCARLDAVDAAERDRLRRAGRLLAGLLLVIAAAMLLAPAGLRHAAGLLLPWNDPLTPIPYRIEVSPGTVKVLAGSDLRVLARAEGFEPAAATLEWRHAGDAGWSTLPMMADAGSRFEALLFDLGRSIEYRVSAEGVWSASHAVSVLPRPVVERIDLTYHFPAASGRAAETHRDGGAIAAVQGTRVELRVLPRTPVSGGRLMLDDTRPLPLVAAADGSLSAEIEVVRDGHYRVELDAGDGQPAPASPDYTISAYLDRPPTVEIRRPGRDAQVTSIEELEIEAFARDDVIVRDLELVLSVNGSADEVLPLGDAAAASSVVASEILRLEDRALEPGDLVAFHVRAADGEGEGVNRATSDLYFLEVRPFDRVYRRAEGGGGGGGGAGGEQQAGLAEQQRELVVALFNAAREGATDEEASRERAELLGQAQARVRDRTEAIVRRLGARPVVEMNPGYRAMAEELPRASSAMLRVEALLAAREIGAAGEPAREALRHLQRADAAFREVQVARQNGAGQGQAGAAEAGDLANLFALEMDRFRSQYAGVQRGRWQEPGDAELDAVAEQLRRLAARQQREVERLRQRRLQTADAAGGVASQQALEAEIERLERELQRLSLQRPERRALADALQRARDAAAAMRDAAEAGSEASAREALRQLDAARQALRGAAGEQLAEEVADAAERASRLAGEQRELSDAVASGEPAGRGEALLERKDDIAGRVETLREQVQRLAREARAEAAAAAGALQDAADTLQSEPLGDALRRGRERLAAGAQEADPRVEAAAAEALEAARGQLAAAGEQLAGEPREGAAAAGDGRRDEAARLESLVAQLEAAERRLAEQSGQPSGGQPGEGDPAGSASGAGAQGGSAGGAAGTAGTAAGAAGGAWSGIAAGGAGVGVGALAPFRGSVAARARDLDRLRRSLPADSVVARDIEAVVAGLLDIADDELASPAHALERHGELLERLRRLRDALATAGGDGPPALLARDQQRAPRGFEALVEEYFRALAATPR